MERVFVSVLFVTIDKVMGDSKGRYFSETIDGEYIPDKESAKQ